MSRSLRCCAPAPTRSAINTAAYAQPDLIDQAAARFGAQCVVASIDVRAASTGGYSCFSHAGRRDTGREPVDWAREVADRGAGEILLTSIDRDGTMQGYDLALIEQSCASVNIPVIASGGAGSYEHMVAAVTQDAGASAVAAASIFHFTEQTPAGAKQALPPPASRCGTIISVVSPERWASSVSALTLHPALVTAM